jgi:hypothetical protein
MHHAPWKPLDVDADSQYLNNFDATQNECRCAHLP